MITGVDKYFEDIEQHRKTLTVDEWGQPAYDYALYATIKGRLRQLSGNEQYQSGKDTHVSTHRLYTRSLDFEQTDKIIYNGDEYDVVRINDVMNFNQLMQVDLELVT